MEMDLWMVDEKADPCGMTTKKQRLQHQMRAGRMAALHSPRPIRGLPGASEEVGRRIGCAALRVSSRRQPAEASAGPEMVPVARMSPTARLHPLLVWWATSWAGVQ